MADNQAQTQSQAQYYDHMTLPGKGPVYFRDAKLLKGKDFSVSGDIEADPVKFDGTGNVDLVARIGTGVVGIDNISDDAKASEIDEDEGKLATVGLVKKSSSFALVTARKRGDVYVPDRSFIELVGYISRDILPVLRVIDGINTYKVEMSSFDGTTIEFRAPDEENSTETGNKRESDTVTRSFIYRAGGFSLVTKDVKPAAYSVETIDLGD